MTRASRVPKQHPILSGVIWSDVWKILSKKMWFQPTERTTSIGTFGNNSWFKVKIQKGRSESQTICDWKTIEQTHDEFQEYFGHLLIEKEGNKTEEHNTYLVLKLDFSSLETTGVQEIRS
jgi:hypothetical protein